MLIKINWGLEIKADILDSERSQVWTRCLSRCLTLWSRSHSVLLHTPLNLITGSSCFKLIYFSQLSFQIILVYRMACSVFQTAVYTVQGLWAIQNWIENVFWIPIQMLNACFCLWVNWFCLVLDIVSLGALRCHENNELEFVSCPVVCVSVWEKLNEKVCVSACFLHLQYQPCWSNIWEQSCQFQQREKQR